MFRAPTTKQWLLVVLLCGAVLLLMAACAAPTPPPAQVVSQTVVVQQVVTATPPPKATDAPKPKGKITAWMWKATNDSIVNPGVVKDFNAEYPDIQVEWVIYNPQDVYQKLPLAIQAGTGAPDVAYVENSHIANYVKLGGFTDLTSRVKPYLDKVNKYKWQDGMKDGKYYAMPLDSGPVVTYYRRDVFKKAGLKDDPDSVSEYLATWDSYLDACKTIKAKTGLFCFSENKANNPARMYETMLWQQGLGYTDASGKITIDSPENIATLEKLNEFWKAGVLSDELAWTDGWYAELGSLDKPVATLVEAAWMGVFLKDWIAPGTSGKWGVALMPAMKAGQVRASNDGGSGFMIPDQSKNKDAAWAFVEFITTRERSQNKIFAAGDIFPSLETAYTDPLYFEPDSFFGGQKTRQIYVDVVKKVPVAYVYGAYYQELNSYVQTAIQKVALGKASPTDALKEAATAARKQIGITN